MRREILKRRLLLAEDDESCRLLVSEILRDANIQIIQAWDGIIAKKMYQRCVRDIDLVIIDICLPGLDGFELLKELRKINPRVIAIAMSALSPSLLIDKCGEAGFDTLISKPFDASQFRQTIISYLKKSQKQQLAIKHIFFTSYLHQVRINPVVKRPSSQRQIKIMAITRCLF